MVSTQHHAGITMESLRADIQRLVVDPILERIALDTSNLQLFVNPAGPFVTGGPKGDAGLTGRKVIVDTYGGAARHGGGAFSGKDPSKVDRSAAYAMRWVAKNVARALSTVFDLRPAAIIEHLSLLRPIYRKVAAYGHFGREDNDFTWERTDRVEELRSAVRA